MLTLSFGFKKPQTGDKGSVFFPALEDDIQQMNDHTHNGSNSNQLTAASSVAVTATILAAAWGVLTNGSYSQTVSMPGGMNFDSYNLSFRTSTGVVIHPSVEKVTATSYKVSVNDNTLTLTVLYT